MLQSFNVSSDFQSVIRRRQGRRRPDRPPPRRRPPGDRRPPPHQGRRPHAGALLPVAPPLALRPAQPRSEQRRRHLPRPRHPPWPRPPLGRPRPRLVFPQQTRHLGRLVRRPRPRQPPGARDDGVLSTSAAVRRPSPSSPAAAFCFPRLEQLTLEYVAVSEATLHGMLSGCPALDCLMLRGVRGCRRLSISSPTCESQ